jgi:hypothetical protein
MRNQLRVDANKKKKENRNESKRNPVPERKRSAAEGLELD